ncbi:HAD family phosphatase [Archangium violaceum]|uniref:HAD family hydrolase n=1 Tax=Archangium violaceum TaxID=83451 RepID=UPI00194E271B|nr:HAD family hydrolase [Archangium violaceum]QRN95639.1 HAD family phosphatase [Archangium violaceum]
MRYLALAMSLDGTLAAAGRIEAALEQLRSSGRRALLVTARRLGELPEVCPRLELFDCVIAENGAVLHWPTRRESLSLREPVPESFTRALRRRVPSSIERGRVVVYTHASQACALVETVRELGLELQILFCGESALAVPPGVNKGAGLQEALLSLGLSPHEVVGIGSEANDHSLLEMSECAVAVADALPALKERAAFVTREKAEAGVVELIEDLVRDDLQAAKGWIPHDALLLGFDGVGDAVCVPAYGDNLLVAGPRGGGRSRYAFGFLERIIQKKYQPCVIDPLGTFEPREDMVRLGSRLRAPRVSEVIAALADPSVKLVVNLAGLRPYEQPGFRSELFTALELMRKRTGRPHWIVIHGAQHLWPAGERAEGLPSKLGETLLVVEDPREVARCLLRRVDVAVAVGPAPTRTLGQLAEALDETSPDTRLSAGQEDEVLAWFITEGRWPVWLRVPPGRAERLRLLHGHVEGDLGSGSFVFHGPEGSLDLRAHNLSSFCQMVEGVDERTWLFHLWHGDYSRWIRHVLRDDELAREVSAIERHYELPAVDSRRRVRSAIAHRYALPA